MLNQIRKRTFFTIVDNSFIGIRTFCGKYKKNNGYLHPGVSINIPLLHQIQYIDMKERVEKIERQNLISKDNVSFQVDGLVQYNVIEPEKAVFNVSNVYKSILERSKMAIRKELSQYEMNEILECRNEMGQRMINSLKEEEDNWGVKFSRLDIQDIEFDESMRKAMSVKAEADRNALAKVINAEADIKTAEMYKKAAEIYKEDPITLRLREYQLWQSVAKNPSNTIFVVPSNLVDFFKTK